MKQNKELLAGLVTLGAAVALLLFIALFFNQCTADRPQSAEKPGNLQSISTAPPAYTLVPNPYDSGDFGYKNGYLTCLSGRSLLGIDVSSHQGQIDWQRVAEEGVEFVIVRVGYRGWGNGQIMADTNARANIDGAKAAGLKVGVYFYSQAISVEEAREEAKFVLDMLCGEALDMPVVFDWEIFGEQGRTKDVGSEMLNACTLAFCEDIAAAGYEPMIYFNLDLARRLFDLSMLQQQGYPFWLAMYSDMTYDYRVDMWQYTGSGRVDGIQTTVDINLYFPYEETT